MARIWSSGAEFFGSNYIEFIGGIRDGEIMCCSSFPPELLVPILPRLDTIDELEEPSPTEMVRTCRYRRLADTSTYICIDWYP